MVRGDEGCLRKGGSQGDHSREGERVYSGASSGEPTGELGLQSDFKRGFKRDSVHRGGRREKINRKYHAHPQTLVFCLSGIVPLLAICILLCAFMALVPGTFRPRPVLPSSW